MPDGYRIGPVNWVRGDKVLPLAILAAAGIGYVLLSRKNGRKAADDAAAPGRAARIGGKKLRTEEPMAGYGR